MDRPRFRGTPDQLVLEHMPTRLFACTPSRLAAFDCPRRYRFTYLDRPPPPRGAPWAHNSMGAAVHVALARWWSLAADRRVPAAAQLLVDGAWQYVGFRDREQSDRARRAAVGWVQNYLSTTIAVPRRPAAPVPDTLAADPGSADPGSTDPGSADPGSGDPGQAGFQPAGVDPVGVERTVAARTARLAVSGRIDRIDIAGDELIVVDYKTGRREPGPDDARTSQPLALYAVAAARTLRRRCVRVELHHLPSGTIAAHEHSAESLARHVARAESTAHDIVAATDTLAAGADADAVFPVRPGPGCSWCDFRRSCAAGSATSRQLDPWAALSADLAEGEPAVPGGSSGN